MKRGPVQIVHALGSAFTRPVIDCVLRSENHCIEQAREAGLVPKDWVAP